MKKAFKFLLLSLILSFISGCAVYHGSSIFGTYDPSPLTGFEGKVMLEPFSDPYPVMQSNCSGYGGLILSSIQNAEGKALGGIYKTYKCYKSQEATVKPTFEVQPQNFAPKMQQPSPPSSINNNSLEKFKSLCKELGFKEGTEAFGNCVLKLSK